MGWAAYRFERPNKEKITVIIPIVSENYTLKWDNYTANELVSREYPVDVSVFAFPEDVEKMNSFGFGNTMNIEQYAGETWTLDNGAKLQFTAVRAETTRKLITLTPFLPNGEAMYPPGNTHQSIIHYDDNTDFYVAMPPFLIQKNDGSMVDGTNENFSAEWRIRYPNELYMGSGRTGGIYPPRRNNSLTFFAGAVPVVSTTDPYDPGGETEPGGGLGDFDGTGDEIAIPDVPTLSAVDAGFITLFNPTLRQMNELASYMWSDLFDVNGWKKIFADPMGAILGLSIVPVAVPSGGTRVVSVGNISTGVSMTVAASQYVVVDCGTLNVNEFWGAYLDYDPYTKAEIYLPYIGTHALATDDIMNKPVHVVYHVDILSGACCAYIQCGGTVLYSFVGQCASSIPITGDNWTNVINGALSIAGSIGSMVATGGASAPMAIGNIASTAVNSMKPTVEKSGSMGGTGGMLGVQTPYLILTRPRQAVPKRQNEFTGYPSFITELLGDLTGYTEIEHIHLENVPATEPELSEIESLLKSGVIF